MHSSGVGLSRENNMKMHDALVGQFSLFTNTYVQQENQFKWAYQIMERRTPSPMVNIIKGHGPFTTPSITITPHPNPFPNSIEQLTTSLIFLCIQILTRLILRAFSSALSNVLNTKYLAHLTHQIQKQTLIRYAKCAKIIKHATVCSHF